MSPIDYMRRLPAVASISEARSGVVTVRLRPGWRFNLPRRGSLLWHVRDFRNGANAAFWVDQGVVSCDCDVCRRRREVGCD